MTQNNWTPYRIKVLRKQYGMSQQEFSTLVGVFRTTLSRWERGATAPSSPCYSKRLDELAAKFDLAAELIAREARDGADA